MDPPDGPDDPITVIAILGMVFGFILLTILAGTAPIIAALVILALVFIGIFSYTRFDVFDDEEVKETQEEDSLSVLKKRYARGEISEEKFEHQVSLLLDVDEVAENKQESGLLDVDEVAENERESEFVVEES